VLDLRQVDEVVPIYILLKSSCPKKTLVRIIQHVEIRINAQVFSTGQPPDPTDSRSVEEFHTKHALGSKVITSEVISPEVHSVDDDSHASAIWQSELHLRHPERQMHRPAAQINASVTLSKDSAEASLDPDGDYMLSGVALPENLLEQLQNSPAFAGASVQLPVSRIQKMVPKSVAATAEARPVRGASRQFPIVPALAVRMHRSAVDEQVLLSLDVEVARWADCPVVLEKVQGHVASTALQAFESVKLPQQMKIGDRAAFVLRMDYGSEAAQLRIDAHAIFSNGVRPQISVRRNINPQIHMTQHSRTTVTRHWQRPTSLQTTRPISLTAPDRGMTFAISAPARVAEGESFSLEIFVVNGSIKKRRLALVTVSDTHKTRNTIHQRTPLTPNPQGTKPVEGIAPAAVDDTHLYKSQNGRSSLQTQAQILSLTADAKVGPLMPGACHNLSLEFLALSPGIIGLEALTIVDMDTRETVHITELPDVVAFQNDTQTDKA